MVPEGIGGLVFRVRDAALRWVARRQGINAPSLLGNDEQVPEISIESVAEPEPVG